MVTFKEIPDEVSLCVNISNCPCHCSGCHSSHLWEDVGIKLDEEAIDYLLFSNKGVTCIALMGGDREPAEINKLARHVKRTSDVKVAWYSGRQELSSLIELENFDFIKLGPYVEELGPIDKETTNQRLYEVSNGELVDITSKFWDTWK